MDHTVVDARIVLDIRCPAARSRLRVLAEGQMLLQASEVAYGQGTSRLVQVAGPAAGLTRLADVRLADLTETADCAHIALQWDAIAADGTLFTALLADLIASPAGNQTTELSLTGSCWPPPERAAAGLREATARGWATAAIGSFLNAVAYELVHPTSTAKPSTAA